MHTSHTNAWKWPYKCCVTQPMCFTIVGVSPKAMRGSQTGVFIGQMMDDSLSLLQQDDVITGYEATGATRSMMANRLSYFFDFHGITILFYPHMKYLILSDDSSHHDMKSKTVALLIYISLLN